MSCWDRWEVDEKCRAGAGNAFDLYVAMVLFDDLVDDRQAEAGAFVFAALVLGREERIKNMLEIRLGNALPCVLGFYLRPRASRQAWPAASSERAAPRPFRSSHPRR